MSKLILASCTTITFSYLFQTPLSLSVTFNQHTTHIDERVFKYRLIVWAWILGLIIQKGIECRINVANIYWTCYLCHMQLWQSTQSYLDYVLMWWSDGAFVCLACNTNILIIFRVDFTNLTNERPGIKKDMDTIVFTMSIKAWFYYSLWTSYRLKLF